MEQWSVGMVKRAAVSLPIFQHSSYPSFRRLKWRFREDLHLEPLPSHGSVQDSYTSEAKWTCAPDSHRVRWTCKPLARLLRHAHDEIGLPSRFRPGSVSFTKRSAAVTPWKASWNDEARMTNAEWPLDSSLLRHFEMGPPVGFAPTSTCLQNRCLSVSATEA